VLRCRLQDGSATDVIGWADVIDASHVWVRDRDGQLVRVDRGSVVVARRVPVARGGPDPMRVSSAQLERIALSGWLAESEPLGDWTLRAAEGFTGRANSCLAVGDPGMTLAEAAGRVEAFAAGHGIAPRAQVVTGSDEEAGLRALGWGDVYVPTDVLVSRLGVLLGEEPADDRVLITEVLTDSWLAAYRLSRPNTASDAVLHRILGDNPPRAFAAVHHGDRLIAIGRAHVTSDWMGIASLWSSPEHRRQGWSTSVIKALGHWAARQGARNIYLQVATENAQAHLVYQRSGFTHHHSYLYLGPPGVKDAGGSLTAAEAQGPALRSGC
jgi:GNAT superfamily N-acetyltransferase